MEEKKTEEEKKGKEKKKGEEEKKGEEDNCDHDHFHEGCVYEEGDSRL